MVLYVSVCSLLKLHPTAHRWAVSQLEMRVAEPPVRRATYAALAAHLDSILDSYPAELDRPTLQWDEDLVQQLLRSETRILRIGRQSAAYALTMLEQPADAVNII